jgi:hypothetical protein
VCPQNGHERRRRRRRLPERIRARAGAGERAQVQEQPGAATGGAAAALRGARRRKYQPATQRGEFFMLFSKYSATHPLRHETIIKPENAQKVGVCGRRWIIF